MGDQVEKLWYIWIGIKVFELLYGGLCVCLLVFMTVYLDMITKRCTKSDMIKFMIK